MTPEVEITNLRKSKPLPDHLKEEHAVGYADRLSNDELTRLHASDHLSRSWGHRHPR
jgi:hypothetical protein